MHIQSILITVDEIKLKINVHTYIHGLRMLEIRGSTNVCQCSNKQIHHHPFGIIRCSRLFRCGLQKSTKNIMCTRKIHGSV
jgi:hypothetical protein